MSGGEAYDVIKASLLKGDKQGNGRISKDLLLKVLSRITDQFDSSALELFMNVNFPSDTMPVVAFLDFIFQRFPGIPGAEDTDLSAIFQCIDKNGNGLLEKQEVLNAARGADQNLRDLCQQVPSLAAFLDVQQWEAAFNQMDTNADGVVSWFEFLKFFAQSGRGIAGPSAEQEDLVAVFMCLDTNRNGALEKSEVMAAVEDGAVTEMCQQLPALRPLLQLDSWKATFEALDTNTDGVISWAEFLAFFGNHCNSKTER